MGNRLVQFTKHVNKEDTHSEVIDVQYHLFTNCDEILGFIHDPIYRGFIDKGYLWSAIDFEIEWADMIGFTISECVKYESVLNR